MLPMNTEVNTTSHICHDQTSDFRIAKIANVLELAIRNRGCDGWLTITRPEIKSLTTLGIDCDLAIIPRDFAATKEESIPLCVFVVDVNADETIHPLQGLNKKRNTKYQIAVDSTLSRICCWKFCDGCWHEVKTKNGTFPLSLSAAYTVYLDFSILN